MVSKWVKACMDEGILEGKTVRNDHSQVKILLRRNETETGGNTGE